MHPIPNLTKPFHGLLLLLVWLNSSLLTAQQIPTIELPTTDGNTSTLKSGENRRLHVVTFLGVDCPLAKQYGPKLQALAEAYESKGVAFLGINSNLQDSMAELKSYVEKSGIRFPVAKDYDQKGADLFDARRTPEVFVLDRDLHVRYRGRIDDQFMPGIAKSAPTSQDLKNAIDALLADRPVAIPMTEAVGCLIGRPKSKSDVADVTYCNQIAKVFQNNCVECHRRGEIGPFAMTEYDELIGWGDMILEVVDQGRMPPWHATDNHLPLKNARSMAQADRDLLHRWVELGMPYGDVAELPKQIEYPSSWRLPREPDLVIAMRDRPFQIPTEGAVEYQYFVVDPGLTEDRWVSAAQVIPGNAAVVHHVIVFIRPPDGAEFRGASWLTAYVPGQRSLLFPEGMARKIPAGSKLVFQMHYTPNGHPEEDITRVGLLFTEESKVKEEVFTLIGIDQEFEIPPHAKEHIVEAKVRWLPKGGKLLAVAPHMHVRGKSFELFSKAKGKSTSLLEVPHYDFNWQHTYELSQPIELDSIDSLEFKVAFDNSTENPVNPNPNEYVYWGDQTWEEMAVTFFEVSTPKVSVDEKRPNTKSSEVAIDLSDRSNDAKEKERFADDFLKRLDRNRDGFVSFGESPIVIQRYSFWRFDTNRDDRIDRQELLDSRK